jgi:hypothetical protein
MVQNTPFNASGNPGSQHADIGGFHHIVLIYEVIAVCLVDRFEDPAADLRQDAITDIVIFQDKSRIGLIHPLIGQ